MHTDSSREKKAGVSLLTLYRSDPRQEDIIKELFLPEDTTVLPYTHVNLTRSIKIHESGNSEQKGTSMLRMPYLNNQ